MGNIEFEAAGEPIQKPRTDIILPIMLSVHNILWIFTCNFSCTCMGEYRQKCVQLLTLFFSSLCRALWSVLITARRKPAMLVWNRLYRTRLLWLWITTCERKRRVCVPRWINVGWWRLCLSIRQDWDWRKMCWWVNLHVSCSLYYAVTIHNFASS